MVNFWFLFFDLIVINRMFKVIHGVITLSFSIESLRNLSLAKCIGRRKGLDKLNKGWHSSDKQKCWNQPCFFTQSENWIETCNPILWIHPKALGRALSDENVRLLRMKFQEAQWHPNCWTWSQLSKSTPG